MFDRVVELCAAFLVILGVTVFTLTPGIYDTLHMDDTLFLAELGWRMHLGATPVIDFNHFYGGITAQYLSWTFGLFGPGIKSLDYAILLQFITLAIFALAVSYKRIGVMSVGLLLLLITVLLLTRSPLEMAIFTNAYNSVSAHSFVYNRYATSLALIMVVFSMVPARDQRVELFGALLCGVAVYILVLVKPTFVIFAPALFLTLSFQRRWGVVFVYVLGITVACLFLDFGAKKFLGSFEYAVDSAGSGISIGWLILKVNALVFLQFVALFFGFFALGIVLRSKNKVFRRIGISAIILMVGCLGMTATMGWTYGQQAVPFLTIFPLVLYEYARQRDSVPEKDVKTLKVLMISSVAYFGLPHIVNSAAMALEAKDRQDMSLIDQGPLRGYVAWNRAYNASAGALPDRPAAYDQQVQIAYDYIKEQEYLDFNISAEYVMLADGIQALGRIKNISQLGIISDTRIFFSYAMQAPPVLDFPVWPTIRSPEFFDDSPLTSDIDIMLFLKPMQSTLTVMLERKRGDDFSLCLSTVLWDIYARNGSQVIGCTEQEGGG